MDLQPEELQFLSAAEIVREAISITKRSVRTFNLITLTLIFPLSFSILVHSLFTHPLLAKLTTPEISDLHPRSHTHEWILLFTYQFLYLIFLFAFSLLSTAAVVFTVASLYTAKPVSFSSTVSAVPKAFKRLFVTYLWITLLMMSYNFIIVVFFVLLMVSVDTHNAVLFVISVIVLFLLFLVANVYLTALWHLASVITVLEPLYGYAAMKKSYELLQGRTLLASVFVFIYLILCAVIGGIFRGVVVRGGDRYGILEKVFVGGFLVCFLVLVNLVGLLVQSVFYYVCKSYHNQAIDKTALHDHLGGYLGEYVPLKSGIQMESIDI